jgi:hypothetical protein
VFLEDLNDYWVVAKAPMQIKNFCQGLCHVKGDNIMGSNRVYTIYHEDFYKALSKNSSVLPRFVRNVAKSLDQLAKIKLQHCDLQPKNLFIQMNGSHLESAGILNYSSVAKFEDFRENLNEYQPPEILRLIETLSY